jgi:hypothetical protein
LWGATTSVAGTSVRGLAALATLFVVLGVLAQAAKAKQAPANSSWDAFMGCLSGLSIRIPTVSAGP